MSLFKRKLSVKMFTRKRSEGKNKSVSDKQDTSVDLLPFSEFLKLKQENCDGFATSNNDFCHKSKQRKWFGKSTRRKTLCLSQLEVTTQELQGSSSEPNREKNTNKFPEPIKNGRLTFQGLRRKPNKDDKTLFKLPAKLSTPEKFNSSLVTDVNLEFEVDFGESHPMNSTFAEPLDCSINLDDDFAASSSDNLERSMRRSVAHADLQALVKMNSEQPEIPLNHSFNSHVMSVNVLNNSFDSCVGSLNRSIDSLAPLFEIHRRQRHDALTNLYMQQIDENSGEILEEEFACLSIINDSINDAHKLIGKQDESLNKLPTICQTINASISNFLGIDSMSHISTSSNAHQSELKFTNKMDKYQEPELDELSNLSHSKNESMSHVWEHIYEDVNDLLGIDTSTDVNGHQNELKSSNGPQYKASHEFQSLSHTNNNSNNDLEVEIIRNTSTDFNTSETKLNQLNTLAACPVKDQLGESRRSYPFFPLMIPETMASPSVPVLPLLDISCTTSEDHVTVHLREATLAHCCSSYIQDIVPQSRVLDSDEIIPSDLLPEDIEEWLEIKAM